MPHFSARKRTEVEQRLAAKPGGRERLITAYLEFSREVARCKPLQLESEQVEAERAQLVYAQTDTCGNSAAQPEKQRVTLVWEDGWKIDEVEIAL